MHLASTNIWKDILHGQGLHREDQEEIEIWVLAGFKLNHDNHEFQFNLNEKFQN